MACIAMSVMLVSPSAIALGIGAAEVNSYIGERLSISIPVFKVATPEVLSVDLKLSSLLNHLETGISTSIDRSNNQLSINIESEKLISEPYLSFVIQIDDQQNSLVKEFTVLLDLAPGVQKNSVAQSTIQSTGLQTANIQASTIDRSQTIDRLQTTNSVQQPSYQQSNNSAKTQADIMGPYEWAQQGSIPTTFGAVLDGQSLWRVARRVNKAMGVSIEQMMLALYRQNAHAFSTRSIDSLRAGSFLSIPEYAEVTQLSIEQAKQQVRKLSGVPTATTELKEPNSSTMGEPSTDAKNVILLADEVLKSEAVQSDTEVVANAGPAIEPEQAFRLSGLEQAASLNDSNGAQSDNRSNEIISSLAVTVGNLTQEMIRKDKQIEFLQEKIDALQGLQQLPIETKLVATGINSIVASREPSSFASRNTLWLWALLAASLAILAFLARHRLSSVYQQLNLFGNRDEIEFAPTVLDIEENTANEYVNDNDYSVLSAAHIDMNEYEVEGVTLLELEDEQSQERNGQDIAAQDEEKEDSIADYMIVLNVQEDKPGGCGVVSMQSWQRRIDKLFKEKKFHQARTILEAARHNEIDDDRYNYERLRLYIEMNEQADFYKYYYEIEDKISRFDESLRDGIGKMIGSLAQQKA